MAWTSPMTWVDGNVLTAAQLNVHLRDNLMETMPAKLDGVGKYTVVDETNHLKQRDIGRAEVNTIETCTAGSDDYGDLTTSGPTVTRITGPTCLVIWGAQMKSKVGGGASWRGFCSISIARTNSEGDSEGSDGTGGGDEVEPNDKYALANRGNVSDANGGHHQASTYMMFHSLGGVDNTEAFEYQFTLKYRCTDGDVDFHRRSLFVWPLS